MSQQSLWHCMFCTEWKMLSYWEHYEGTVISGKWGMEDMLGGQTCWNIFKEVKFYSMLVYMCLSLLSEMLFCTMNGNIPFNSWPPDRLTTGDLSYHCCHPYAPPEGLVPSTPWARGWAGPFPNTLVISLNRLECWTDWGLRKSRRELHTRGA